MIIGVDGNEANVKEKVGVSVYTFKLLKYFHDISNADNRFVIHLKTQPKQELPHENQFFKYRRVSGNFLWSQIFLPFHLYFKKEIDVFFSPAHYAPRLSPVPCVITIHDLSYFYYPQEFLKKDLYQLKKWTAYSVAKAQKIIAVSKTTKKDLMKFYHIPEEKIAVIYNGCNQIRNPKHEIRNQNPYILYVGTLQPRKNVATLIEAFHLLLKEKPEYRLIIVGKKGWLYENIFDQVNDLKLHDKVTFTGYVSDEEKNALYANASVFVLPSLYEGFGIPLLEAMSWDCPVIASWNASLPEIGADACLYFDPKNPDELKNKMFEVITNKSLRQELIHKGKKRVELFSWEKCGKETLEVIKSRI